MFAPPTWLRNEHVQSILASAGPRRILARQRARTLLDNSREIILDAGDDVRLQGYYTPGAQAQKLVVLLHGWLGCATSSYLLSAAASLHQAGFSVFRLNLRDHGESHHLNRELFHSARIQEVLNAIAEIQRQFPHPRCYLAGYSLGGNFALRVAALHDSATTRLDRVVTVCPVIDPATTMQRITDGLWVYHWYFVKRWKRSLQNKLRHYPEHDFSAELTAARTLNDLNSFFVPRHTPYESLEDYFAAYSVGGDMLANLAVPTHIIHSQDDPVVDVQDLQKASASSNLQIELTRHGGHCGFLKNSRFHTWIDERMLDLFTS